MNTMPKSCIYIYYFIINYYNITLTDVDMVKIEKVSDMLVEFSLVSIRSLIDGILYVYRVLSDDIAPKG